MRNYSACMQKRGTIDAEKRSPVGQIYKALEIGKRINVRKISHKGNHEDQITKKEKFKELDRIEAKL